MPRRENRCVIRALASRFVKLQKFYFTQTTKKCYIWVAIPKTIYNLAKLLQSLLQQLLLLFLLVSLSLSLDWLGDRYLWCKFSQFMQNFGLSTLKITQICLCKVIRLCSIFHFNLSNCVNLHGCVVFALFIYSLHFLKRKEENG